MEKSKAMEYESGKASSDVLKQRNIYKFRNSFTWCGQWYSKWV